MSAPLDLEACGECGCRIWTCIDCTKRDRADLRAELATLRTVAEAIRLERDIAEKDAAELRERLDPTSYEPDHECGQ